jgi:hypothetical protein
MPSAAISRWRGGSLSDELRTSCADASRKKPRPHSPSRGVAGCPRRRGRRDDRLGCRGRLSPQMGVFVRVALQLLGIRGHRGCLENGTEKGNSCPLRYIFCDRSHARGSVSIENWLINMHCKRQIYNPYHADSLTAMQASPAQDHQLRLHSS